MKLERQRLAILLVTLGIGGWLIGRGSAQLAAAALFDVPRARPEAPVVPTLAQAPTDACAFFEAHPVFDSHVSVHCDEDGVPPTPAIESHETEVCATDVRLLGTYLRRDDATRSFAAISDATGASLLYREGMTLDGRSVVAIRERSVLLASAEGMSCTLVMSSARTVSRGSPIAWVMPR